MNQCEQYGYDVRSRLKPCLKHSHQGLPIWCKALRISHCTPSANIGCARQIGINNTMHDRLLLLYRLNFQNGKIYLNRLPFEEMKIKERSKLKQTNVIRGFVRDKSQTNRQIFKTPNGKRPIMDPYWSNGSAATGSFCERT